MSPVDRATKTPFCILCAEPAPEPKRYTVTLSDTPVLDRVVLCPACVAYLELHGKRVVPIIAPAGA